MILSSEVAEIGEEVGKVIVTEITAIDLDNLRALLNTMGAVAQKIRESANSYPENPINASVWMDGATLAAHAEALTNYLHTTEYINYEAHAAQVWANVTLSVCGHYHHLVGPAMITNAQIAERMDNIDFAMQAYKAVLNDFTSLLDDCETYDYAPEDENAIALNSLKEAVESLIRLYDGSEECAKAIEVQKRLERILGKKS